LKSSKRKSRFTDKHLAESIALKAMSDYVRERDSWTCVTCGKQGTNKQIDAGHFIPRGYSATKFMEENVNAQCKRPCNYDLSGNWPKYYDFMVKKYGRAFVDNLIATKSIMVKRTIADYLEIAREYKHKLVELLETKGEK
jgi:5-methylcytosine-specific restriction endonuclease McrA